VTSLQGLLAQGFPLVGCNRAEFALQQDDATLATGTPATTHVLEGYAGPVSSLEDRFAITGVVPTIFREKTYRHLVSRLARVGGGRIRLLVDNQVGKAEPL